MSTASYAVAGLRCEYGMAKVLENVSSISGVTDVAMDYERMMPSAGGVRP